MPCADPEIFVRVGPNLITFLGGRGVEDPNAAINGSSSARQRNAIEMAFHWRPDGGQTLNDAGLVVCGLTGDLDQYCLETLFLVIFQTGSGHPPPPILDTRIYAISLSTKHIKPNPFVTRTQRLIRYCTVCLQNVLLRFE